METTKSASLGELVRRERRRRGWTQEDLAERSGVPQPTISDIERGARKLPQAEYRRRLARTFGLSQIDLLVAAGELLPDEVPGSGIAETGPPYDPNDPRAVLATMLHDLPDDAVDSILSAALWWERQVKSRVIAREEEPAFHADATHGLGRW